MPKRVSSSEFRVTYVRLDEPVAVTVLDRVIGYYIPGGILDTIAVGDEIMVVLRASRPDQQTQPAHSGVDTGRPEAPEAVSVAASVPHSSPPLAEKVSPKGPGAPADGSAAGMSQADRDKVLAKVRKGRG